ncbi:L,D-transpeptidase family protein [Mucilaginibacter sp. L3T2-6]|uniref:L,D-transpeptidase family protein n=1 Tax=Mucilaginibacter sp. L3T2-6 TaxID=3062491 RepID=UPI002677229A|nr:L,D-transpeptidase family protein [Mucilaginibacter sp. L3T2-6]MDO3643683.1 L,D-transpeptidase family protein [Mucilaginibacter sp. L3T2-6]MDV6216069.1 L,D-transpeptidase family protein [Mucilaginibacter sp. L3T2-6]
MMNSQTGLANNTVTPITGADQADTLLTSEIRRLLAGKGLYSQLYFPKSAIRFYTVRGFRPAWLNPAGGDIKTLQALKIINCVSQYGLSCTDYHLDELPDGRPPGIADTAGKAVALRRARYEILLTDAMLTLINNLHFGKMNSDHPSGRIDRDSTGKFQAGQILQTALLQKDITAVVLGSRPSSEAYLALQRQLELLEKQYQDGCCEPLPDEIRKIMINMERLRWAGAEAGAYIHINIPSYTLKLWIKDTVYKFKVIVGKPGNPTPTLQSAVNYFTTAPEWRVPAKIFRRELLPKMLRYPAFLENNHYGIYDNNGRYIEPTRANLLKVKSHPEMYYTRQSPGCDNSLGLLVFRFPNIYDVYLHDTPEQKLFARTERHFSHGCVRVEQAEKLGRLLLINDGSADKMQVLHNGMAKYIRQDIRLKQPVPIMITYLTCEVVDGKYITYPDIYGLDEGLEKTLFGTSGN